MPRIDKKRFGLAVAEMEKVAEQLALSKDIVEEAKELLKSLWQGRFVRRRSYLLVALGCLYYQIKREPTCLAISFRRFAEVIPFTQKEIFRVYIKIVKKEGIPAQICTLRPTIFVKEFGKKMGFSKRALARAIRLAEEMVKERVHLGKNPIALATTCLYVASLEFKEGITQSEISEACGIEETGVTIRNTLGIPFFAEKVRDLRYQIRSVSEEVLLELVLKLLAIKQRGIPFSQLRQSLRCSFPNKLRGFSVPYERLNRAIRRLISKDLITATRWSGCEEKDLNCPCSDWSCKNFIVQPK